MNDLYSLTRQAAEILTAFEYQVLIRALREGDTLIIKSIDRLGRNYNDITEQLWVITKEIKAYIKVLDTTVR